MRTHLCANELRLDDNSLEGKIPLHFAKGSYITNNYGAILQRALRVRPRKTEVVACVVWDFRSKLNKYLQIFTILLGQTRNEKM